MQCKATILKLYKLTLSSGQIQLVGMKKWHPSHDVINECFLTPSLVQVQLVQGEIFREDPSTMSSPLTLHWVTSSFQWLTSISGLSWHGARGFLEIFFYWFLFENKLQLPFIARHSPDDWQPCPMPVNKKVKVVLLREQLFNLFTKKLYTKRLLT